MNHRALHPRRTENAFGPDLAFTFRLDRLEISVQNAVAALASTSVRSEVLATFRPCGSGMNVT